MYENLIEHQQVSYHHHHHHQPHHHHHEHHEQDFANLNEDLLALEEAEGLKQANFYDNNSFYNELFCCQIQNQNEIQLQNHNLNQNKRASSDYYQQHQQQQEEAAFSSQNQPAFMMEDPVYLEDEHVLNRMLASEKRQNIPTYFETTTTTTTTTTNNNQQVKHYKQLDFTIADRRELAQWMRDVCLAEECQADIFPLSILIVDRFLNFVQTKRQQLQLLGSVALLLASKLRQTIQIPAKQFIFYTRDLITLQELKTWEFFVLTTLKWDLSFITPVDFLDIYIKRLTIDDEHVICRIEKEALELIFDCCLDFKHALYPPSMIAWACLMQAMEPWKVDSLEQQIDLYPPVV